MGTCKEEIGGRFINLTSGDLQVGHQNQTLKRLYLVQADRIRNGRVTSLVSAFAPHLAAKKVDNTISIDTSSARVTELHRSADLKPKEPIHRLVIEPVPPLVNVLSNEYVHGFNDRLSYTGRQKAETRAKNAHDAAFFIMGFKAAERRLKRSKPKRKRKVVA